MLKKIFLILPPTPPPWGGVKVEKFRFLGFTKYPKALQHRVIARQNQLNAPNKKWAQFWPLPPHRKGRGYVSRKKRQDEVTVGHTNKKNFFSDFFSISFRKEDGSLMLKKYFFLILPPTPLCGEGSKLKNFDFQDLQSIRKCYSIV